MIDVVRGLEQASGGVRFGSLGKPAACLRVWLYCGLRPGLQNEVVAEERSALLKEALPFLVRSITNEKRIICALMR
jgi:hypothetical protein